MKLHVLLRNIARPSKQLALIVVCWAALAMPQMVTAQAFDYGAGVSVGESIWPCFPSEFANKRTTLSPHALGAYALHIVDDDLSEMPVEKYAQSCQESYDFLMDGNFNPSTDRLYYFAAHTAMAEELATALSDKALTGGEPFYAVATLGSVTGELLKAMEACDNFAPNVSSEVDCKPETMKPVVSRLTDQLEDALAILARQDKKSVHIADYLAMIERNRAAIAN